MTVNDKYYAFDVYNMSMNDHVFKTLNSIATDSDHIPIVLGCDMYNFQITGDISANLNASSCNSPTHSGPTLLILNDQGGDVMNVSDDISSTLRAQDHGHPPVVCFAECNSHLYISEESSQTIRAESHGALPIVCMGEVTDG